ncbi:MAG: flotillin-like FloA family protein [Candidatus Eremiobacteraeota bacterium]|nr:flotillin-like FloA family protein [Candidatus Eremiobacteraeota bacterium]
MVTFIIALIAIIIIFIIMFAMITYFMPISLWIEALSAGVPVPLVALFTMRLRRVDPYIIIRNYIKAKKGGVDVSTDQLETHYLAGGNVSRVVNAMIRADRAGYYLTFERACAIDLAGESALSDKERGIWKYFEEG